MMAIGEEMPLRAVLVGSEKVRNGFVALRLTLAAVDGRACLPRELLK
jgi:hypothetical protein